MREGWVLFRLKSKWLSNFCVNWYFDKASAPCFHRRQRHEFRIHRASITHTDEVRLSYRAKREGSYWRWELLCDGIVVLQGIAITHAAALSEVVQAISNLVIH